MTPARLHALRLEAARLSKLSAELREIEALSSSLRESGSSMTADDAARLGAAHTAYRLAERARWLVAEYEGKVSGRK